MSFCAKSGEHLCAEGGITTPLRDERDPLLALDDLMAVIEALCPEWPQRETFENADRLRL